MEPKRLRWMRLLTYLLIVAGALLVAIAVDMGAMSLDLGVVVIIAMGVVAGLIKLDMYN